MPTPRTGVVPVFEPTGVKGFCLTEWIFKMTKKQKLALNTTSIRNLTDTELDSVAGGIVTRNYKCSDLVCPSDIDPCVTDACVTQAATCAATCAASCAATCAATCATCPPQTANCTRTYRNCPTENFKCASYLC